MRKAIIWAAWIGALGVVAAAIITAVFPSLLTRNSTVKDAVITGIVVDGDSNAGIGQAHIVIDGRSESYITEDTGNFRIEFPGDLPKRVRVHVTKPGFKVLDVSVEVPAEGLIWQLTKQ